MARVRHSALINHHWAPPPASPGRTNDFPSSPTPLLRPPGGASSPAGRAIVAVGLGPRYAAARKTPPGGRTNAFTKRFTGSACFPGRRCHVALATSRAPPRNPRARYPRLKPGATCRASCGRKLPPGASRPSSEEAPAHAAAGRLPSGLSNVNVPAGNWSDRPATLSNGAGNLHVPCANLQREASNLQVRASITRNGASNLSNGASISSNEASNLSNGASNLQNGSTNLQNGSANLQNGSTIL